jgi:Tol biopolymer transport system component
VRERATLVIVLCGGLVFASRAIGAVLGGDPVLTFTRADGALAAGTEAGTATTRLVNRGDGFISSHAWSHDGTRIAVSRCLGANCRHGSVWLVNADGRGERLVGTDLIGAAWMPDDEHLIVDSPSGPQHWIVALSGGARRPYRPGGNALAPFSPRLSPDGRWLLHLTPIYGRTLPSTSAPHHAYARNWLLATDLSTGRSRRVSSEPGLYYLGTAPWSPDGMQFTFTRRKYLQASGGRIYVATPAGSARVVADGARDAGAWSPDGSRLAFNTGKACAIRVVSVDGGTPARTLAFSGCRPTWRPQ